MKIQSIVTISVLVLLLALLAACGQIPIAAPETGHPGPDEVTMPQPAGQPAVPEKPISESAYFAANPELMVVGRYAAVIPEQPMSESTYFAANPELMAAGRYSTLIPEKPVSESTYFAANPELMAAERFTAEKK